MFKKAVIFLLFSLIPFLSFSTHIVGGVLNYKYNGGNIYTITLKLYRDCGSSAAAFPGSVSIKIKGNNGANLSPSKDLTISLGNISTLSANLLPCAVAPNPMPCVQEGVYTKTISLPPNIGGYHLYYQVSARNLSLTNINGACNCIGESFYAFIPNNTVNANSNSNAVFSLFPPLFICAGQPFTFNHSATDADGDSLAYSLYTPYNDNVTPTYSNNIASFPEVVYLPGYNTNNPLGASPFFLNPVTGVLTGTPGIIGQFVVGVRVKEYRNGVYISQTLRDFQFNVLNCPAPPPTLAISNMTLNNGCAVKVTATGITAASSTWRSIYPGAPGAYNNYLSCTSACLNPTVTATGTPPPYVDFVVCGVSTNCLGNNVCDTFRVHFNPPLSVSIAPSNPALCNGQTSTTITAIGSGGTPPYIYLWNNVNPTQTISVGAGTYNIKLTDASGCPPAYNSAVVTSYSVPVSVTASANKTVCITNPVAALNSTITGATGGIWSGGTGTYSPNNITTSNLFYTPSASELAAGSTTLIITTTGNGACPSASAAVILYYSDFTGTVSTSTTVISCYGGSNGSASLTINGGMGPHSFLWSTVPTQTTIQAANLSVGNYSVNITNAIGCQLQKTVSITQPLPVNVSSTITNIPCFGGNNGSIQTSALGGTAPYTYSWSPSGVSTSSQNNLIAGTYTLKTTDSKNCSITSTFAVTQSPSLTLAFTQTQVSCFNGTNGQINSIAGGGNSPYSYTWSPGGASAPNLSALSAGVYSLILKDNLNCSISKTVAITQAPALTLSINSSNESCTYLNNGSANALVSGGTAGYTYTWLPGSFTTSAISNLSSGTYSLSVSDAKGCTIFSTTSIQEPPTLQVFLTVAPVKCSGGNTGSITANVSGGSPGYNYTWSNSAGTSSLNNNLVQGSYSVSITDSKSCTITATGLVTEPAPLTASVANTGVSCYGGSNGTATAQVSGGTAPYSYFWSPSGQSTFTAGNLSAGTFSTLITDAKGCTISTVYSIAQTPSLTIAFTQTSVGCYNGNNGVLNAGVSGGNAPYTYNWSPGNLSMATATGLTAGIYTLTVSDLFNCNSTRTVSLLQAPSLTLSASATNETCNYLNNGTASVLANGGTGTYTYLWQPGSLSTTTISNLSSGNYTVTVSDVKGCTKSSTILVNEPAPLTVSINTVIAVSCFGGTDGSATAMASGGTPNYTYSWSPSGSNSAIHSNLSSGIYTLNVSDNKGCITQTFVNIPQASSITIAAAVNSVSCFGGANGSINLTPTGGTSPYSYFWLPLGQTTSSITGLTAGIYSVTVNDAKGCQSTASYSVSQSSSITIAFTSTQVSCFNGSNGQISSTVAGGNPSYTFSWSPGGISSASISGLPAGSYSLTVTDNLNCSSSKSVSLTQATPLTINTSKTDETCDYLNNGTASVFASGGTSGYTYFWQPGAMTTSFVSSLTSGIYSVTATDAHGCTETTSLTINQPAPLTASISAFSPVSCFGGNDGSAIAMASGGTPNYSYTWTSSGINSPTRNNLSTGLYSVTVTDSQGCTNQTTISITQPASITITSTLTPASCFGGNNGSITTSVNGGSAPYTYFWLPLGQTTSSINSLIAGTYSTLVTDAKGCTLSTAYAITQSSSLTIAFTQTNVSCFNGTDGSLNASVSGGNAPYTFLWSFGGLSTQNITGLPAGTYTLTVTDNFNCNISKTVTVTQPSPLVINTSVTDETCDYLNNGTASAFASGGMPGYTYLWQPGAMTTASVSNLASNSYSVFATDISGCVSHTTVIITEPSPVAISFTNIVDVSCNSGNDGSATVIGTGGTPNYSYTWQPGGATGGTFNNLSSGTYTVFVSDNKGCATQNTVNIAEPASLNLITSVSNVVCNGGSNGIISILINGGTSPYSHILMPGNISGANFSNLSPGTYSIFTSDANGCVDNTTISINQPINISTSTSFTNADCSMQNGVASISVTSGGTPPFSYNWLPSGGTNSISTSLFAGSYSVDVTDALGCISTKIININNINAPLVSIISSTNVSCFGGSNGALEATFTGGTGASTYSWSPTGGTGLIASNLISGVYVIQVTDNAGCIGLATSSLISQPADIAINISPSHVSCFGGLNGSAFANITGGTPSYAFNWMPGSITSTSLSGVGANTYTLKITDANNCVQSQTVSITQPTAALNVSVLTSSVSCYNGSTGSFTSSASGGTTPYSYNVLPGNLSGQTLTSLVAGNYTITAKDLKACTTSTIITISQPSPITLTTGAVNSNCSLANGQVSVTASGGTGAFNYLWSPSGATTSIAANLIAGNYTLTATDANNCSAFASQTLNDNPQPLVSVSSISNVSCFNGANGTATAAISGGTGPFTYAWFPAGGTASVASGLSAGTYSVLVTSANSCTVLANTPFISQPTQIFVSITPSAVGCFSGNNGEATAIVNGGTPGYTFNWQASAAIANTVSGLSAGNYTMQVTDANACSLTSSFTVTQPAAALSITLFSSLTSCFGGANGAASATISGGTAPYNFNWTPGNFNSQTISNLTAGVYSLTSTDVNGCSASATVLVNQPSPITLTTGAVNSNCSLANGQVSVSASGGAGSYSYTWAPGTSTGFSVSNLASGNYTVTVKDVNQCQAIATQTLINNPEPVVSVSTLSNVSCFNGSDGAVSALVTGGIGPFTYFWFPSGSTTSTVGNLSVGVYSVIVSSANGCTVMAASPLISQPSPILINFSTSAVSCFAGNNGSVIANVNGGVAGYTFNWQSNASTTYSSSSWSAGNYTLQVTDANLCVRNASFTVSQPSAALSVSLSSQSASCFAGTNGSANVIPSGGTAPYSFNWMPGNFNSQNILNLSAGTYSLNSTDAKGCSSMSTVTVNQPSALTLSSGAVNSNCGLANGQTSVTASGGTGSYSYSWMPAGGTNSIATNLIAGNYTVTVTDVNQCTASISQTLNNNPEPLVSITSITNVSCFNGSNGAATAVTTGGTGPFTYSWMPTGGTVSTGNNLSAGTYSVLVTSANGCTVLASSPLITQPLQISTNVITHSVSCFAGANGSVSLMSGGGTPGYTYTWPSGAITNSVITGLSSGNYQVLVSDLNLCVHTITFSIDQPATPLSISITTTGAVSCYGASNGSASVNGNGGTPVYTYQWMPYGGNSNGAAGLAAGVYTAHISDFNNCSASTTVTIIQPAQALTATSNLTDLNCFGDASGSATVSPLGGTPGYLYQWLPAGGTSSIATGLSSGNYSVNITDLNNCQTSLAVFINQPAPLSGSLITTNASCGFPNGSITGQISGGTAPYTYTWLPGNTSGNSISNLLPGTYTLQTNDAKGCLLSKSSSLTNIPGPQVTIPASSDVSCFSGNDGSATLTINQGTAPFSINWLPFGGNNATGSLLLAGTYTAMVTDALGCIGSNTINISDPPVLNAAFTSVKNISCFGASNGSLVADVSGGTAAYSYSWSNGSTNNFANNLNPGTYTLTIKDSKNCKTSLSTQISQPALLSSSVTGIDHVLCYSGTGSASVSVKGGEAPYTYSWTSNPVQSGDVLNNVPAGSYTLIVTDANKCITTKSLTITQPSQIFTSVSKNDTLCYGKTGTLKANANGGAGNYYYTWLPGAITNSGTLNFNASSSVIYTVLAFDERGCSGKDASSQITVYNLTPANLQIDGLTLVCPGKSSVIEAVLYGNNGPLTFKWNNNLPATPGAHIVTPAKATSYILNVTNSCGFTLTDSIRVLINDLPDVKLISDTLNACVPGIITFTDLSTPVNTADPLISWTWDFGDGSFSGEQNPSHTFTQAGTYTVNLEVTTDRGCSNKNSSSPVIIHAYPQPVAQFTLNSDSLNLPYDVLKLTNQSSGAISYAWTFGRDGKSTSPNPEFLLETLGDTKIELIAYSEYGCSDTTSKYVNTNADVVFPTAFTPNEEGSSGGVYSVSSLNNDVLFPYTSGVVEYKFQIFNRWGELIFESNDVKQGWDGYYRGKLCQVGVYVWKAHVKLSNGRLFDKSGNVSLLR